MANPTQGDVYINQILTNISIAYMQSAADFVSVNVFPIVPVQLQGSTYFKFQKDDWFRTAAQLRADGTESAGGGWNLTTDTYFANPYAIHKDIGDQTRANAVSPIDLDTVSTQWVARQLLLKQELLWLNKYFAASVWGQTDQTGVAAGAIANQFLQWDNASSDPISVIQNQVDVMKGNTGVTPNTLVLGPLVYRKLINHPAIIDRIKYTNPGGGFITEQILASALGVDRVFIPRAVQNTAKEGATDALTNYSFLFGKSALLMYVNPAPSLMMASAGYTFSWVGYTGSGENYGTRIKKFRMEHLASDRVEGELALDLKLVASDLGVFFATAIA